VVECGVRERWRASTAGGLSILFLQMPERLDRKSVKQGTLDRGDCLQTRNFWLESSLL
jgi:hypothetical protein